MSTTRSKFFEEFIAGVREPISWSNIEEYRGIGALKLLEGDERTEAEDILIERLDDDDGRAASALAQMKSTRAIPALRSKLARAVPDVMRLAAVLALHRLADDSGRDAAIDVLAHGMDSNDRLVAVSRVAENGDGHSKQALETAVLTDADSTVRSSAAAALIELHGLQEFNRHYRTRLGLLQGRCSSPLVAVRTAALDEMSDIFARFAGGETADRLGLTWLADNEHEPLRSFEASLHSNEPPYGDDFALDIVASLDGWERTWAENRFWHFLPLDPRAARAISRLQMDRGIAPLRELLQTATGAIAIETAAALWRRVGDEAAHQRVQAATRGSDPALAARAKTALQVQPT